MSIKHVLVVDDEPDICELLEITLQRMGIETTSTTRMRRALELLEQRRFDLCLTDMRMPDGDGLDLVRHIQKHCPNLPVAVITAHGSVDTAVSALKLGAFDYVNKPVDLEMLRRLIDSALRLGTGEMADGNAQHASAEEAKSPLLGDSEAMVQLRAKVARLARSQAPVMILGESGSGKELVAREIHRLGPRSDQPFIPVNCGAIPSELMESEFFGHCKGAFTGAVQNKEGLFREAHGGTLFLDEIAELPVALQVKLLRALQERAIKPVGSAREESVDVRILSATHKNLQAEVENGHFRQDLYYRLNVVELRVPSLRERPEDIDPLARHILGQIAARWGLSGLALDPAAQARLAQHHFPGNVRELENILERAAVMMDGPAIGIDALDFPERTAASLQAPLTITDSLALNDQLDELERAAVEAAIAKAGGDPAAAARVLGLSGRQLSYRMKKWGIA